MNKKSSISANVALYQKGPLFFLWARYPTNSNTWQRKPSAVPRYQSQKKIQVEKPPAPQDRNHIGARPHPRDTPPSWFGSWYTTPRNGSLVHKNPEASTEKPSSRPQKGLKTKAKFKVRASATAKGDRKNHPCKYRCTCCLSVCVCARVRLHVNVRMHLQVACST